MGKNLMKQFVKGVIDKKESSKGKPQRPPRRGNDDFNPDFKGRMDRRK